MDTRRETRAVGSVSAAGRRLTGLALPYDRPARVAGRFTETVAPGAMIPADDVLLLAHHDPALILARTANGSLRLDTRGEGVAFEADLPDTTLARDVLALVEARTLAGCSAGFMVEADEWPAPDRRIIRRAKLAEISLVSMPVYAGATRVAARSAAHAAPVRVRLARRLLEALAAA